MPFPTVQHLDILRLLRDIGIDGLRLKEDRPGRYTYHAESTPEFLIAAWVGVSFSDVRPALRELQAREYIRRGSPQRWPFHPDIPYVFTRPDGYIIDVQLSKQHEDWIRVRVHAQNIDTGKKHWGDSKARLTDVTQPAADHAFYQITATGLALLDALPKPVRLVKPTGRPVKNNARADAKLYANWQAARGVGTRKREFAKERGMTVPELNRAINRHQQNRRRAKSDKPLVKQNSLSESAVRP